MCKISWGTFKAMRAKRKEGVHFFPRECLIIDTIFINM